MHHVVFNTIEDFEKGEYSIVETKNYCESLWKMYERDTWAEYAYEDGTIEEGMKNPIVARVGNDYGDFYIPGKREVWAFDVVTPKDVMSSLNNIVNYFIKKEDIDKDILHLIIKDDYDDPSIKVVEVFYKKGVEDKRDFSSIKSIPEDCIPKEIADDFENVFDFVNSELGFKWICEIDVYFDLPFGNYDFADYASGEDMDDTTIVVGRKPCRV